jgi:cytochrome d ubiquinol oxidase subunit II
MIRGISVVDGQYAGGAFGWLHPFAILTGIGLVLGYALLGAGWLVLKSTGDLRDWAYDRVRWLAACLLAVLFLAFAFTFDYSVLARSNLLAHPWAPALPVVGLVALVGTMVGTRQYDSLPFALTVLFFLSAFLCLAVMFWPYLIPYSITVASAAAPEASLRFLFYGAVVALPAIAIYTIGVYWVFRGKFHDEFDAPSTTSEMVHRKNSPAE